MTDVVRRRVALAVAVIVPAAAFVTLARVADPGVEAGPTVTLPPTTLVAAPAPPAALATPLLSYRRVGPLLSGDQNIAPLRDQLNGFAPQLGERSCMAVAVAGTEVAGHNADLPVVPASNQKVLTATAALHVLGPDHRFTTTASAVTVADGAVVGDLYLVGGGDPNLSTPDYPTGGLYSQAENRTDLNLLAAQVAAAGITRIDGAVVGDGSRYDDEYSRPGWGSDVYGTEVAPYDALLVNDSRGFDGAEWRHDGDPSTSAAAEFTRLLQANGVAVAGAPTAGATPGEAQPVTSIQSAPVSEIVGGMLESSDNNTAELLVKEMDVARGGAGTTDGGAAVMLQALAELGVNTTGLVIVDGSGLSTDDRLTCRALLQSLARHSPTDALGVRLPVAGQTGTLTDVFTGEAVAGRLRAKTGNLQNIPFDADPPAIRSLSGYLPVDGGAPIEFALVLNEPGPLDQDDYRPRWYAFAAILAAYPATPTANLGPR